MKRLEATPREEVLIASYLGTSIRDLVGVVVAMVTLRLEGNVLVQSKAYQDALEAVGNKYCPVTPSQDLGSISAIISSGRAPFVEMPEPQPWSAYVESMRHEILAELPLVKFLAVAGFEPMIVLNDSYVFRDDYARHFTLFNRNAGVQLTFKRRGLGGN